MSRYGRTLPRHRCRHMGSTCQSTQIRRRKSAAGEHSESPLAPTNEGMLPVTIPAVTSRRSRRSPWVSDTSSTIASPRTAMLRPSLQVEVHAMARQRGPRLKSTPTYPSSPSVSSSCRAAAAHANTSQRGRMERLGDLILHDSRVSSIADRHGTDRLQPLRTWINIACQSVFSPIGNESQPTDGPISTSPMPTSCIASRTPGPLVVGGVCSSAQHGRDSCRLRTHWVWPNL